MKLRECPFCGTTDLGVALYRWPIASAPIVQRAIACRRCGARGPSCHDQDRAAADWNERWTWSADKAEGKPIP